MNRRDFVAAALAAGLGSGGLLPSVGAAHAAQASADASYLGFDLTRGSRTLDLYRPSSGERLAFEYMRNGEWVGDAYSRICWLLRDVQSRDWVAMDPTLIAILDWTQRFLRSRGYTQPLHIHSGYRSPRTNALTEGAAKNSQHLSGKAVDVRIPGLPADYLGRLLAWLGQGGVGTYDSKEFVHIDTGRVRRWHG